MGLHDPESPGQARAFVTDVDLNRQANIQRLRDVLAEARAAAKPIITMLRQDNHLERFRAAAIGATCLLSPDASFSELSVALEPRKAKSPPTAPLAAPKAAPKPVPTAIATPSQKIEQARQQFGSIFDAAGRGEPVSRASVDKTTASIMDTVADGGIRQWLEVVWSYDDATYQHCLLVTGLAAEFANCLRFSVKDQKHLIRGALLHDVGKAKIPHAVLSKPGKLDSNELAIMRRHPTIGYELLHKQGEYESELLDVVLRHHEVLDGSGYPDGLTAAQIGDLVRLVTVCDIYAALIERRPYKQPMEPAQAYKILQEMDGKLEGALVRAFIQVAEKSAASAPPGLAPKRPAPALSLP